MIGLRRNKRGDMVLTIDSFIDVDSTPDIQSDYFDCLYINTTSERAFHAIMFGASPILSYKCSYKPLFANTAVSGKEQMIDYIVDAYVSDMSNEKVYEIIDKIKKAKEKYGIKQEIARPTQPNQLFSNILRYLLSRDQRVLGHRLMEKSSLGYINPIFEHYHSMSLFHLAEMFTFKDSMVECGALRKSHYLIKEHLCPKCNHSHLLYTECCPNCGSSNLKIQNIIHHFSCANVAPESAYNVGGMLICPKCHKKLRHIGVDYDRPAVIYSCNDCENSFTTPLTKATCCYCQSTYPVNALVPRDVVDYEITEEGIRMLTKTGLMFSNMSNTYDNYMDTRQEPGDSENQGVYPGSVLPPLQQSQGILQQQHLLRHLHGVRRHERGSGTATAEPGDVEGHPQDSVRHRTGTDSMLRAEHEESTDQRTI